MTIADSKVKLHTRRKVYYDYCILLMSPLNTHIRSISLYIYEIADTTESDPVEDLHLKIDSAPLQ